MDEPGRRRVEWMLREAGRLAKLGFLFYDARTGRTWWYGDLYRMSGRDPSGGPPPLGSEARGVGRALAGLVRQALETGERHRRVLRLRRKDGQPRWYRLVAEPDRGPDGVVEGVLAIAQDLTGPGPRAPRFEPGGERNLPAPPRLVELLSMLTPRELEVCRQIHGGLSSKEIARKLGITVSSVETHRRNIRRRLKLEGRNLATHLQVLFGRVP